MGSEPDEPGIHVTVERQERSNPMTDNTLAFISRGAFEIDGEVRDGVVTANLDEEGRLEIVIQPLCQLPYPIDIRVVLDEQDLASVNALLRAQADAEQVADLAPAPDGSRVLVGEATDEAA